MSANNIVHVNFRTQPVYEIAGALLVALLYSEPRDTDEDRSQALTILCARALHARAAKDVEWANSFAQSKPCYATQSIDGINNGLRRINRRLRRRWIAGELVLPLLEVAATGHCPAVEQSGERFSINKLAERFRSRAPVEDVTKRIWLPSRPVLHIAAAFSFEKYTRAMRGEPFDFDAYFWDPMFVARIIAAAELYEPLIEKSVSAGRFELDPAALIRLRASAA